MATKSSKPRDYLASLRAKDPLRLNQGDVDALMAEGRRRVDLYERFEASEEWKLMRKWLEAKMLSLKRELDGMVRRLSRPTTGRPPVTLEQIAFQNGLIEQNKALLVFPATALHRWRQELEGLEDLRRRQA